MRPSRSFSATPTRRQHHFLVVGEIVFHDEGDEDSIRSTRLNGVLIQKGQQLSLQSLQKCQEILQLNFHQRAATTFSVPPVVKDVVIYHLTHLGHFTPEEFEQKSKR